jgi:CBS domain-containing protein
MNAYELCQRHVVTVRRHEDLTNAAWIMRERNVGCLVVVDPAGISGGERPVGILTDRDIVTTVIARGTDLHGITVAEVMSEPVIVSIHGTVDEALLRMRNSGVRRVAMVDDRGRLAGILALDDIYEHLDRRSPSAATPIRRGTRFEAANHL